MKFVSVRTAKYISFALDKAALRVFSFQVKWNEIVSDGGRMQIGVTIQLVRCLPNSLFLTPICFFLSPRYLFVGIAKYCIHIYLIDFGYT